MAQIIYGKTEVDNLLTNKQNVLTAGTGITIANDVISASGGSGGGMTAHTYTTYGDLIDDIVSNADNCILKSKHNGVCVNAIFEVYTFLSPAEVRIAFQQYYISTSTEELQVATYDTNNSISPTSTDTTISFYKGYYGIGLSTTGSIQNAYMTYEDVSISDFILFY